MPSQLHEALLDLFRNRPQLAPELLRNSLCMELPEYTDVGIDSADLTTVQPAGHRADSVVLLSNGAPVLGIIVEVQLSIDERKRFVWPAYAVNLRARRRCPVCLLVVCPDSTVALWAAQPIDLDGRNMFVPCVLGSPAVGRLMRSVSLQTGVPFKCGTQRDFARGYYVALGRVEMVTRLLKARFGPLSEEAKSQLDRSSSEELYAIVDRSLAAATLQEALAPRS